MSTSSDAPLTHVVFHALLALSEGPLHGYAVMKRMEEESGLRMGPGTVYGSLGRLADAGLVEEVDDPEPSDRRRSLRFRLTPEGRDAHRGEAVRITRLARLEGVKAALAEDVP